MLFILYYNPLKFYLLQLLAESEDYDLLAYEAQRIVDQVLTQSLLYIRETIQDENENQRSRFIELENDQWKQESIVKWPTIAEFIDENVGLEKIKEYIEKVNENLEGNKNDLKFCFFSRNGKQMNVGYMQSILLKKNLVNLIIFIYIE